MKNIVVDYRNGLITLSSAFERKAFTPGTAEYAQLLEVRHEFPDFRLETRQFKTNTAQDRYKGLTYEYMRWYIGEVESKELAPAVLEGLESMIRNSLGHSTGKRYPTIKKWFLTRYPEFAEFGMSEEQVQKYRDGKAALEAAKAAEEAEKAAKITELPLSDPKIPA